MWYDSPWIRAATLAFGGANPWWSFHILEDVWAIYKTQWHNAIPSICQSQDSKMVRCLTSVNISCFMVGGWARYMHREWGLLCSLVGWWVRYMHCEWGLSYCLVGGWRVGQIYALWMGPVIFLGWRVEGGSDICIVNGACRIPWLEVPLYIHQHMFLFNVKRTENPLR